MRLHAVLDLAGGRVVHGKGGERASYRPVRTRLVDSADPVEVARALRGRFGLESLYIADLDAIAGKGIASEVLESLKAEGFELLVDAGSRDGPQARLLLDLGVDHVVAPLETLADAAALRGIIDLAGADRVVFSLDLKDGAPLGGPTGWPPLAVDIVSQACQAGARRVLVLELARVGSRAGPAHLDLIRRLRRDLPAAELLAGGGIRCARDLEALGRAGVTAALVATAFHEGGLDDWFEARR